MKHLRLEYVYKTKWKNAIHGFQRRFETIPNPKLPAVVDLEVFDEEVHPERHEISWRMRVYMDPPLPGWLMKFVGVKFIRWVSHFTLNYATEVLSGTIENEDLRHRFEYNESCSFTVHPDNKNWTLYTQNSALILHLPSLLVGQAEHIILKKYREQFYVTRRLDECLIRDMLADLGDREAVFRNFGVGYLPEVRSVFGGGNREILGWVD
eukprot:1146978_1